MNLLMLGFMPVFVFIFMPFLKALPVAKQIDRFFGMFDNLYKFYL